jgi:hypothetical protein
VQDIPEIVNLNTDSSVSQQPQVLAQIGVEANLTALGQRLRLWIDDELALCALRCEINLLRKKYATPWLTFLGSGDFHHLTLALLDSLPIKEPLTLVLIDNHPDWFCENPTCHCGNWVSGVLALSWVKKIIPCLSALLTKFCIVMHRLVDNPP